MLLRYMIVGGLAWFVCCFGMKEDLCFNDVVQDTPIQELERINKDGRLKGSELDLADKFYDLYIQKTDREKILRNLKGEDLKEIYLAANFVARSFFAEMTKNHSSVNIAQQTVDWLELLESDIRTKHIYEGAYPEGARISDLLNMAREELDERKKFEEEDQKCEEEICKLLEMLESGSGE